MFYFTSTIQTLQPKDTSCKKTRNLSGLATHQGTSQLTKPRSIFRTFSGALGADRATMRFHLATISPRSHGVVVRAVAFEASGPGYDSSSGQMFIFSPRV